MKFVLDKLAFEHLTQSPEGDVGKFLRKRAIMLQALAQRQVGVKTGALRASISYRVARDSKGLIATVGSNNRIALMHHNGTKPHIILPRRAQTLRFYSHGKIVYSKMVHHPGTQPNKYLTDNLARAIRTR
jgi:Bacteriophage HK97-gp10, putative tail-component